MSSGPASAATCSLRGRADLKMSAAGRAEAAAVRKSAPTAPVSAAGTAIPRRQRGRVSVASRIAPP